MSRKISEIRIRPVQRYAITEFTSVADRSDPFAERGSIGTLGEFQSYENALDLAKALVTSRVADGVSAGFFDMVDADEGNFVIVQALCYEPETIAYYAQTKKGARQAKADAEAKHGGEFRIYRAESVF